MKKHVLISLMMILVVFSTMYLTTAAESKRVFLADAVDYERSGDISYGYMEKSMKELNDYLAERGTGLVDGTAEKDHFSKTVKISSNPEGCYIDLSDVGGRIISKNGEKISLYQYNTYFLTIKVSDEDVNKFDVYAYKLKGTSTGTGGVKCGSKQEAKSVSHYFPGDLGAGVECGRGIYCGKTPGTWECGVVNPIDVYCEGGDTCIQEASGGCRLVYKLTCNSLFDLGKPCGNRGVCIAWLITTGCCEVHSEDRGDCVSCAHLENYVHVEDYDVCCPSDYPNYNSEIGRCSK